MSWVLLPLLCPQTLLFLCVSPINKTLQALGSTVTQEQGVSGAELCSPAPLSPAPLAFLLSTSLQILSKGQKTSCKSPVFGGTH